MLFVPDARIRTVITFNNGGKWWPLKKPENVDCEESARRVHKFGSNKKVHKFGSNYFTSECHNISMCMFQCNLHIHGEHSHYSGISPMLPLSDPSVVGLIIAHGNKPTPAVVTG